MVWSKNLNRNTLLLTTTVTRKTQINKQVKYSILSTSPSFSPYQKVEKSFLVYRRLLYRLLDKTLTLTSKCSINTLLLSQAK